MATVACVYVRGHVPFSSEYVNRLASMVTRYLDRPFRFVCLTDKVRQSIDHPAVEQIRIDWIGGIYGWWAKLHLFRTDLGLAGRVLYLDLDTLIVNPLDPILEYPAPFALLPHAGQFQGKHGRTVVKRFNSSVMVFEAGTLGHLYTRFTPDTAERLWGDQDWIGEQCPEAATLPPAWCPRFSDVRLTSRGFQLHPEAKIVLMKTPKNKTAARLYPWVRDRWQ